MSLQVIGVGVGRTGTYSLKLAINRLGFGPCHHMEEVLHNQLTQVPLWTSAIQGQPDWTTIYEGYESAVDWPTAKFFRELSATYPGAKFILTVRSPESWAQSFSQTIYQLIAQKDEGPDEMRAWLDMCSEIIAANGFPVGLDEAGLMHAFNAHTDAVQAAIPPQQLLVYQVKEGWEPLCEFLGVPVPTPAEPFPRTNDRAEFWDLVTGGA